MISSIAFVNQKGDTLIYREFKDDVRKGDVDQFVDHLLNPKNIGTAPIHFLNGVSFFHKMSKDLFVIASTKGNENPSLVFEFIYQLLELCRQYFKKDLSDNVV